MNEMIKQIAQIDSVAVSNRRNSEQALKERKEQYEKEILDYNGETDHNLEEEKCKKLARAVQNRYLELEEILLNQVFNELFRVEE